MKSNRSVPSRAAFALVLALGLAACDNPVAREDHVEPAGVQVLQGGQVIAETHGDHTHGRITVRAGEESPHLTVRFVDDADRPVELGSGYYLAVAVADAAVAAWEQDTPGEFGGHVHGRAAGTTTVRFRLMHGRVGGGHADFESLPFRVEVTP